MLTFTRLYRTCTVGTELSSGNILIPADQRLVAVLTAAYLPFPGPPALRPGLAPLRPVRGPARLEVLQHQAYSAQQPEQLVHSSNLQEQLQVQHRTAW